MTTYIHLLFMVLVYSASSTALASGSHDPEVRDQSQTHKEHKASAETNIDVAIAKQVGIDVANVSEKQLKQRIKSYGSLVTSPEQLSHVRARFPGLIRSVHVSTGDHVNKGKLLAKVESNDSLQVYSIDSPIDGTVIQRHANTGEFTSNQVLFSIANFDTLWAELRIYPTQRALVAVGQSVEISTYNQNIEGVIAHLIPVINQPYQLARVKIDNMKLSLAPGILVEGYIEIAEFTAQLTVINDALQTVGRKTGVFIKHGNNYSFSALELGRKGAHFTEVISGIEAQQTYVSKNSYLIKADIEKSEAEHSH